MGGQSLGAGGGRRRKTRCRDCVPGTASRVAGLREGAALSQMLITCEASRVPTLLSMHRLLRTTSRHPPGVPRRLLQFLLLSSQTPPPDSGYFPITNGAHSQNSIWDSRNVHYILLSPVLQVDRGPGFILFINWLETGFFLVSPPYLDEPHPHPSGENQTES